MSQLPSGTVTFLFTDIEGSSRLWQKHPRLMGELLSQHDRLIQEKVTSQGGVIVKHTGDGFFAAFPAAAPALAAAISTQQELQNAGWVPEMEPLKVRMSLHTGTTEPRNDDYYGPAVNRASRLCDAAHGRQVLISAATQGLLKGDVKDDITLLDLGRHQLKGLIGQETIYQLLAPGLPSEFPPLRNLESEGHSLPVQATAFLGRQRPMAELSALIQRDDVRLVTLSGPGGTGKTRLSLVVAESLLPEFPGGIYFVEFAHILDPEQVMPAVAESLSVPTSARRPAMAALARHFADRKVLLVLDNFEQVIGAASQITQLLSSSESVKILVTSREVLRVYGEHEYPLPPLSLPPRDEKLSAAVLAQNEAIALFRTRASAVKPGFTLDDDNAVTVSAICRRLDGLPLAIELAASQIRFMTPETLLKRLQARLPLVAAAARDVPERQQTIQAAIDWSYNLLDEQEKALFGQLSVFVEGWSLEAAEAVCRLAEPGDVLAGLAALRDKSLIQQEVGVTGETRFAMLETIRAFAREKFRESDEEAALFDRHIRYFIGVANEDWRDWILQYGLKACRFLFLENYSNVSAAMKRALAAGKPSRTLEIGIGKGVTIDFLSLNARLEFLRVMREALDKGETLNPQIRAKALYTLASTLNILPGHLAEAGRRCEESLALHRKYQLPDLRIVVNMMANIQTKQGLYEEAMVNYQEALELARQDDDPFSVAIVTGNISSLLAAVGELQEADAMARLAIELCTQDNFPGAGAVYRLARVDIELQRGNVKKARLLADDSLKTLRNLGRNHLVTWGTISVGRVAIQQGEEKEAAGLLAESFEILQDYPEDESMIQALEATAELLMALGRWEAAARIFGSASSLRGEYGLIRLPVPQREFDAIMAQLRDNLDQQTLQKAWEEGESLSWEPAIEMALSFLE